MISLARIFGGARKVDVAGTTVDAHLHIAKVWSVNSTAYPNSKVRLPSWSAKLSRRLAGADLFILVGVGTHNFDVVDSAGATVIANVDNAECVILRVTDRSGIGTWAAKVKSW